ncbi:MAG: amidohydrolase, partial [Pedobacter sp.]
MDKKLSFHSVLLLSSLIIFIGCKSSGRLGSDTNSKINPDQTYVITHVNIISMAGSNDLINNATVVIANKKIQSINSTIPSGAKIIDGKGKWLMPGLIDMHVHNLADISFSTPYPTKGATLYTDTQDFMLLYVANGVTTCLELNGRAEHFGQRNEILKGNVIGPRIALAYLIEGGEGNANIANTPEDGRQTVRIAKGAGFEFIKVYSHLTTETFTAIVDEANKQGMKVAGHIPNAFQGKADKAFIPHFGMVAHAEEFAKLSADFSDTDAAYFAKLAKNNGTWLTPTLTAIDWIGRESESLDSLQRLSALKYVHPMLQNKWIYSNAYK